MSWFGDRVVSWKTSLPSEVGGRSLPWREPGPPLKVLIPDATRPSSYEVQTFADAAEATAFFDDRFHGRIEPEVVAFWALTWQPDTANSDVRAESVVIISDPGRPCMAYSFSFVDMESAMKFLRTEFALGLDLACVQAYWGVPLRIELVGSGQLRFLGAPPVCPQTVLEVSESLDGGFAVPQPTRGAEEAAEQYVPTAAAATAGGDGALQVAEMAKQLKNFPKTTRWQKRRGRFGGFKSPPGRF